MTVAPAERVAQGSVRIVVQGETGTGKERVARAIHEWSGRGGKFVGVNCAALAEGLVEAELFGHRKGAFTGADRSNLGHFRTAERGTLLLDEVTEMPLCVQPKLLRALEERAVMPVGESTPVPVDVRVITATQEPLQRAVGEKRFRADLCARLAGLTIALPPLRDRSEDVPGLFGVLLQRHLGGPVPALQARLVERLCLHSWAFNVREVDKVACGLAGLHPDEPELRYSHVAQWLRTARGEASPGPYPSEATGAALPGHGADARARVDWPGHDKELQRQKQLEALGQALRLHGGNITRATEELGISRQKAYRLMEGMTEVQRKEILLASKARNEGHKPR
jgi:DNA-binding NtrC family response regulator